MLLLAGVLYWYTILIHHGDADTLTPLEQSLWFQEKAEAAGGHVKLRVHRGGKHGWWSVLWDIWDIRQFAQWFDTHLQRGDRP